MKNPLQVLGLTFATALAVSLTAQAQNTATYNGNGNNGFDGAVGAGMLTLSTDGTTLTGTITNGNTTSGFNDTPVIYIDTQAGGFTSTSSFTDSGGGTDNLRSAISGYNPGTGARATVNFATGFGANYAIALGPASANYGALFTLNSATSFTYGSDGTNGNVNFTPTGTGTSSSFTFSLPLSLIGSPTSFTFATTYLDGGTYVNPNTNVQDSAYRSNETYGNSIVDTSSMNTGNIGDDTATLGFQTFSVPEPGTWTMMVGGCVALIAATFRRRRV